MNVPNQLTVARLLLAPVFVVLLSFDNVYCYLAGHVVFIAASVTDYFDGHIARKQGLITNFGKLMDPLADKILLASAFVMLMYIPDLHVPGWTIVAILAREFLVTGGRSLAAAEGNVIPANKLGKMKTVFQMTYVNAILVFVIAGRFLEQWIPDKIEFYAPLLEQVSMWGIIVVALYTVYSGVQFARVNWEAMRLGDDV